MYRETVEYWKDRLIHWWLDRWSGPERRLKTGMHSVLLQLDAKGELLQPLRAVELFGRHGLWHTMDYVGRAEHLDFFEINKRHLDLARRNLKGFPVTFHHANSIAWIQGAAERYNFVVADTPIQGPFYNDEGLPLFFHDLLRITTNGGALVFNFHTRHLLRSADFQHAIVERCGERTVRDLFFVPRNRLLSYAILVVE